MVPYLTILVVVFAWVSQTTLMDVGEPVRAMWICSGMQNTEEMERTRTRKRGRKEENEEGEGAIDGGELARK